MEFHFSMAAGILAAIAQQSVDRLARPYVQLQPMIPQNEEHLSDIDMLSAREREREKERRVCNCFDYYTITLSDFNRTSSPAARRAAVFATAFRTKFVRQASLSTWNRQVFCAPFLVTVAPSLNQSSCRASLIQADYLYKLLSNNFNYLNEINFIFYSY